MVMLINIFFHKFNPKIKISNNFDLKVNLSKEKPYPANMGYLIKTRQVNVLCCILGNYNKLFNIFAYYFRFTCDFSPRLIQFKNE